MLFASIICVFCTQRYRASLPIAVYRSIIVTAIDQNQVVVLCGETGWYAFTIWVSQGDCHVHVAVLTSWRSLWMFRSGKSTQLPAFILEHELSQGRAVKIFCTEPRRISAISLAQRVSQELGEPTGAVGQMGSLVGYNIRLESKISPTTRLVYATTVSFFLSLTHSVLSPLILMPLSDRGSFWECWKTVLIFMKSLIWSLMR